MLPVKWASTHVPGHNEYIPGTTSYLRSRTFQSWFNMLRRCHYKSCVEWSHYGGRGITVNPKWLDFQVFLTDMGHRPKGMTLDRIDPDGNYIASNCRWADASTQASNQRRYKKRVA